MEPDEPAWSHVLRSWFFRPDLAGRSAYLAVDQETLSAIAAEWGFTSSDPAESLSRAVRYRVSAGAPLSPWVAEAIQWRRTGCESDPPFLAVLAVTVLAATIVDDVNDRSYYRRLNGLLGLNGAAMPRDFDSDIQQLWTYLNDWLTAKHHGLLGTATATNVGGQANVGWAQSQILLRTTDRIKLPLFFTELGLQPGQTVDGDLLVSRLRSWSADGRTMSRRLGIVLQDPRLSELLADTLHSELVHWDGTLRDQGGRVALRLMLAFHERSARLQIASQVPDDLSGTIWSVETPDAGEVKLELTASVEPQLLAIPVAASVLEGIPLHARPGTGPDREPPGFAEGNMRAELALVLPNRDVHLLSPDDRLARWVEVPVALLNRPHLILVRSGSVSAAQRIMSQLSSQGVQYFRRIHKPAGWEAFKFTPGRYQAITGPLAALSPRGNELSAMDGGLPISKRKRIYLRPGAPDLVQDLQEKAPSVLVDGTEVISQDQARLRLADLHLAAGIHSVAIGGVRYRLTLVDEFADEPFDGALCFTFRAGRDYRGLAAMTATGAVTSAGRHSPDDVTIKGAAISISSSAMKFPALPHAPHIRAGGRHYVLGRPGEVAAVDMPPPKWLQELGLNPHIADAGPALAAVPFAPAWVMRVTPAGVTVSSVHAGAEPILPVRDRATLLEDWHSVIPHIQGAVAEPSDQDRWAVWKQGAMTYDPAGMAG
jgi:hypothetical protein